MLAIDRLWWHNAKAKLRRWWRDDVLNAPLESILHPSRLRLMGIGLFTAAGHVAHHLAGAPGVPPPCDSAWVRGALLASSAVYLVIGWQRDFASVRSTRWFSLVTWLQLPWFFSWIYIMNGGQGVALAGMVAMILVYFQCTDWRLASTGLGLGILAGAATAWMAQGRPMEVPPAGHLLVGLCATLAGLLLGMSSANLRRVRLIGTLSAMGGAMAHELRTPLATVHLMGDVLRNLAQHDPAEARRRQLEDLGQRLQTLVRGMHRHIDMQIANAQLMRLPREQSRIRAGDLVTSVVDGYPYRTSRERHCVSVLVQQDFHFRGSYPLFAQALANLIKNALHALMSSSAALCPGDLRLTVSVRQRRGRIVVADDGVGIPDGLRSRIFEPFYSTQAGAGNGLGLSFCKNVVEDARGRLSVHSQSGRGTVFTIDLPLDRSETPIHPSAPLSPDPCH